MAESVFTDGLLFLGAVNLTGQIRETSLVVSAETPDTTSLEDTSRNRVGGLKDVVLSAAGYFDSPPDSTLFSEIGVANTLITACPTTTLGDPAFFFRALVGEYSPIQGTVGEVKGFTLNAGADLGDLVRGYLMEFGTETVTGNGTGRDLGTVSAAQYLYACAHVTAVSGNWDIIVQSDSTGSFLSPADQITFSGITAVGDQFDSVAGAITDDNFRIRFVENSAGSITVAVAIGIQ